MKARDYFEELVLVEHDLRRAREMLDVAEDRVDGVGGSAALPGVTPADLGNGDAVELADEQERLKANL